MNSIQDVIIKAIKYIVNHEIKKAEYDRTIIGTITDIIDKDKYEVALQNNKRVLNCAVDAQISINDIVYITLPQNNMTNAYICGIQRK